MALNPAVAGSRRPGGGNVLYMDGHVEFLRYPAEEYPGHRLWACFVAAVSNM